jgi:simple sugar transport system ATP-binding protein
MTPALSLENITKRFPGVLANDRVSLTVAEGEIHAICGENGAGKSTLMNVLYGMLPADEGRIVVRGDEVDFRSPRDALAAGIGMVHQHFMLADNLTVLENIILGAEPTRGAGRLDFASARNRITELGDAYGLDVHLDEPVENLGVGERQRVEIIKVLYRGARILILDEPTSVLVPHEVEELFRNMRDMCASGETIVFIDHKLDEVLEIADTITVLRAGRTVATVKPADVTPRDLAELMVGSELPTPEARTTTAKNLVSLQVEDLSVIDDDEREVVKGIDLEVREGEIVGMAGVEGNGQIEFVEALLGVRPPSSGHIRLAGTDITDWSVRRRREAGIGYIPEDRHRRGLLLSAPLWENAMCGHQSKEPYSRHGFWLTPVGARDNTEKLIAAFDVRTPGTDVAAHALSGGNQQKLIIGREMIMKPNLLIAAHPTRGIDVGAQAAVWETLHRAREQGLAVLLVSADLDELIGLSDRLLVIFRGRISAALDPTTVTPRELGAHMTGASGEVEEPQQA